MTETPRGQFSQQQVAQLLQPIMPKRVLSAQGHSHVSQQDITAHLIRMLGFGNFDIDVLNTDLVFEEPREKDGTLTGRWDVCYKALVRLTIRNEFGVKIAHYENGSMATAQNQNRGDGHDLAYKSAISLSIKRAAIALGDQFGLSLYNKGQLSALVIRTLVGSEPDNADLQADIPQQVSLGNDEIDKSDDVESVEVEAPKPVVPAEFIASIQSAESSVELQELWTYATSQGWSADVRAAFTTRKNQLGA